MRRVDCPRCGIKVERVPWAEGKNHLTTTYAWFLAKWAKRLSWKEVADAFQTKWDNVFRSVKMAVAWGLANRNLDDITAIGIDEICWRKKSSKFLTLVYQIDNGCKRLLWIGKDRTKKTLVSFFDEFGPDRSSLLRFICTDMWKPYLQVVAEKASQAINVLDRFHIMSHMNKAIDKVRATEYKALKIKGKQAILTGSRWCLLKRPENCTEKQAVKLKELVSINLKTVRAYLLKEDFQRFWSYKSASWAAKYLDQWCKRTMRSRIDPMKKIANMLRSHRSLILNWFRAKELIALGAVEGLNNKAKVTTKKAYGFKSFEVIKLALYHTLGKLPEPVVTHKFCG
jgi:transposase